MKKLILTILATLCFSITQAKAQEISPVCSNSSSSINIAPINSSNQVYSPLDPQIILVDPYPPCPEDDNFYWGFSFYPRCYVWDCPRVYRPEWYFGWRERCDYPRVYRLEWYQQHEWRDHQWYPRHEEHRHEIIITDRDLREFERTHNNIHPPIRQQPVNPPVIRPQPQLRPQQQRPIPPIQRPQTIRPQPIPNHHHRGR